MVSERRKKTWVLLADPDRRFRRRIREFLQRHDYYPEEASSFSEAMDRCRNRSFDVVLTELWSSSVHLATTVRAFRAIRPDLKIVVVTNRSSVESAVDAFRSGASDYLVKPVIPEQVLASLQNLKLERRIEKGEGGIEAVPADRLIELPQELARKRDPQQLAELALDLFLQLLNSKRGAVSLDPNKKRWIRRGLTEKERRRWLSYLEEFLHKPLEEISDLFCSRSCRGGRRGKTWHLLYVPILVERISQGGCLVLREAKRPFFSKKELEQARFLASHIAVSWPRPNQYTDFMSLAYFDPLTGLFNTRFLDLALEKEIARSKRGKGEFSILFLDLDLFKEVTDSYGHLMGGIALREVARVVERAVRDPDLVFRFGGDEFVILLIQTGHAEARKIGERVRKAMEQHLFLAREGFRVRITASIGVATFPTHAKNRRDLLHIADRAMYFAKESSRNAVYSAKDIPLERGDHSR